jgi:hypothetical protein
MANQANRNQTVHTFSKGMNKDLDYTLRSNDMYYDAENLRLTTSGGSDNKILKNINGVLDQSAVSIASGYYIIGTCSIRNYLILFTTDNTNAKIYRCMLDTDGTVLSCTLIYDDSAVTEDTSTLGFKLANKIKAIGRYENEFLVKVYWTDGLNSTKVANVAEHSSGTTDRFMTVSGGTYNASTNKYKSAGRLEFLPDVILPELTLDRIISGNLTSGVIQYSYQFYTNKETESTFAPLTASIPTSSSSHTKPYSTNFYGDNPEVTTGMGVRLSLINPNNGFNYIRLIAIQYETLDGAPIIRIADEKEISDSTDTIYMVDTGESLGEYTLEEFSVPLNNVFKCGDLEEKDNILFASNITESYFDLDEEAGGYFDSRAYRFDTTFEARIYNEAGYYTIDGTDLTATIQGTTIEDLTGDWTTIPSEFDCINHYNDTNKDDQHYYRYMYQSDGSTIGGEGPNISYTFSKSSAGTRFPLDRTYTGSPWDGSVIVYPPGSYGNYASPFLNSTLKSWARDEVYRVALVAIDNKGRSSFPKWIGDIRLPAQHNGSDYKTIYKDGNDFVHGNVLYPIFSITGLPSSVVACKIVYVKRELGDRSILAQGILSGTELTALAFNPIVLNTSLVASTASVHRFYSPEISFNQNLEYRNDDYLQIACGVSDSMYIEEHDHTGSTYHPSYNNRFYKVMDVMSIGSTGNGETDPYYYDRNNLVSIDVTDGKLLNVNNTNVTVGGLSYNGFSEIEMHHGSSSESYFKL